MFGMRSATLVAGVVAILAVDGAWAHGPDATDQPSVASGAPLSLTVQIDPADAVPPVVTVPLGAHVRLNVTGAGAAELHLHGYDVEASGRDGPAVLVFHAAHEGRFPVAAHVEGGLLGRRDKPMLFVEVRAP